MSKRKLFTWLAMVGMATTGAYAALYSEDFEGTVLTRNVDNSNLTMNTNFFVGELVYTDLRAGINGTIGSYGGSTAIIKASMDGVVRGMAIAIDASTWASGNLNLSFDTTLVTGSGVIQYGIYALNSNDNPVIDLGRAGGDWTCATPSPVMATIKEMGPLTPGTSISTNFVWSSAAADTIMISFASEGTLETALDNILIDVAAASGPATLSLAPDSELTIPVTHPATVATNSIVATYLEGGAAANGKINSVNVYSNGFSLVNAPAFPVSLSDSATAQFDIAFDASVTGVANGPSTNLSGMVEIIWEELGGNTYTNTLALNGDYNNPPFNMTFTPSPVAISIVGSATAATNLITVDYIEGPAHTNAQITSIVFSDATHSGFSYLGALPLTLNDPQPSTETFSVVFDNTLGGLANKQSASASMLVTYHELGSTNVTRVVPVSAKYLNLPEGVIQLTFDSAVAISTINEFANKRLYDYGIYTNQFNNSSAQGTQDVGDGYIQIKSGAINTRAMWNLVQNGTAGMDNFGAADTVPLTSGLYQYQFDYEVVNSTQSNAAWTIDAYAVFDQVAGTADYVWIKDGITDIVKLGLNANGNAQFAQHADGTLAGTNNVSRKSGSVTVDIADGYDSVFVFQGSADADVRLYDLVLVRLDPPTEVGSITNTLVSGQMVLSWLAQERGVYAVQKTPDLVYGPWTNVQENIEGLGTLSATNDTTDPKAFYRVILQ